MQLQGRLRAMRTKVKLGSNGQPDLAAVARLVVSDDQHRQRSDDAEAITRLWSNKVQLPSQARGGGQPSVNPNTKEQRRLTRGAA